MKKQNKLSLKKRIFNPYTNFFLSLILVLIGGVFVFASTSTYFAKPFLTPSPSPKAQVAQVEQPVKPTIIYIPRIKKVLNISDGTYSQNRWKISTTGVSYLTSSVVPGAKGNSVLYGHNLKNILGDLPNLRKEDTIYVVLSNGEFAKYRVEEAKKIKAQQTEILNVSNDYRLTIFTCTGFLDTARFVVIAKAIPLSS